MAAGHISGIAPAKIEIRMILLPMVPHYFLPFIPFNTKYISNFKFHHI